MSSTVQRHTIRQTDSHFASVTRTFCLGVLGVLGAIGECHAEVTAAGVDSHLVGRSELAYTRNAPTAVLAIRSRIGEPSSANTALSADPRVTGELAGVGYRWWSSHGRTDVGVGLGTLGRVTLSPDPYASPSSATLKGAGPVMVLGWRYRVSNASAVYADASRASLPGIEDRFQYNAKLGMEWRAAKSQQLGFEPGTLGVQFDSGYRMSVRLRSGGVKLMLRSQF